MSRKTMSEAIDRLASQVPNGHLLAASDPVKLLDAASSRLAAWEPVVRAAEEMRRRWDERASPAKQQDAAVAVVVACRRVPKEEA
jgi:hypothetical protein